VPPHHLPSPLPKNRWLCFSTQLNMPPTTHPTHLSCAMHPPPAVASQHTPIMIPHSPSCGCISPCTLLPLIFHQDSEHGFRQVPPTQTMNPPSTSCGRTSPGTLLSIIFYHDSAHESKEVHHKAMPHPTFPFATLHSHLQTTAEAFSRAHLLHTHFTPLPCCSFLHHANITTTLRFRP